MRRLGKRRSGSTSTPGRLIAADRRVDGRPVPESERDPAPIVVCVDEPAAHDVTVPGICRFRGWAITRGTRPVTARVRVAGGRWQEHACDRPHGGVAEAVSDTFGEVPDECGFDFRVQTGGDTGSDVEVLLEFTDGEYLVPLAPYRLRRAEAARPRADYKNVWNSVSGDVDSAKTAVAGYTDEEQFRQMADVTVQTLENSVGLGANDVVLEIGAGVGRVGPAIAPKVKRWIATDVSENMLEHAQERNAAFDNIDYVPISGWDLAAIGDESVDVVYCTVVFMHLDEWERWRYIKEAMRVLRSGGRLYVDNTNLLGDDGWAFFVGTADDYHPLDRPPNVSKSSTPDELRTFFERAGFLDIVVQTSSMWIWVYGRKPQ